MPRTKNDIVRTTRQRRQRIVAWLHANGPAPRSLIAQAIGIQPDILTMDLAMLQSAGQIEKIGTMGKSVTWRATGQPDEAAECDITTVRQKQQQTALQRLHRQQAAESLPGYRFIRLLNKPARETGRGGQCAITHHGSLQCGQHYEAA